MREAQGELQKRLVDQLCRYIDACSTTGKEAEYLRLLEADLQARGYRAKRQPVAPDRWNLLGLPKGELRLLFSTHVDVVPPHLPSRVESGRVYGRGACDTKGGLVAMLEAADRLDPERRWIGFLLLVGEEVDHIGAEVARGLSVRPGAIVLCEPTRGCLISGQKGILKLGLSSRGEAAHSAFPELGRDALGPLLDTLQRVRSADYPTDPVLGPTTVNIGMLRAGVAANVTPPRADAELMYRVVGDLDGLLEQVRSLCDERVEVEVQSRNPALTLPVIEGFETDVIAFNTDAHYLLDLAPVYLIGPGDIRLAHGDHEHMPIVDLLRGVEQFVGLVDALRKGGAA